MINKYAYKELYENKTYKSSAIKITKETTYGITVFTFNDLLHKLNGKYIIPGNIPEKFSIYDAYIEINITNLVM